MNVEIIAEIANAHQGEPEQAAELARAGFDAGADAVKFQVYFPHEFIVERHPRFEHFANQSFSPEVWSKLIPEAKKFGSVYCDVFGVEAVTLATNYGADGFKIHSSDTGNLPLLKATAETGGKVFLSSGGSSARELGTAVCLFAKAGVRPIILHGFQSYPTEVKNSDLRRLHWLTENFGDVCDFGYADHVAGDGPFAHILPAMALPFGIQVIEKHITLDREAQGIDYYSSINVSDLAEFIEMIREAESGLGTGSGGFSPSEIHYRDMVKKHFVAAADLRKGHVLCEQDLVMKRVPGVKGSAVEMDKLVGRALLRDISVESRLSRADVRNRIWALPVARSASARLPGKALIDVAGMPALGHLFQRLKRIGVIDRVIFCTTHLAEDDALEALAKDHGIHTFRGPIKNVLARMVGALDLSPPGEGADVVLRVTGDDILIDKDYVERAISHHLKTNAEYTDLKELPSGTEVEIFDADLLRDLSILCSDGEGTEYLTYYVLNNSDQFRISKAPVDERHARNWRLTLDTPEDYEVVKRLLEGLKTNGRSIDYNLDDIVTFFETNPEVLELNAKVHQCQAPIKVDTRLEWRKLIWS